MTVNLEAAKLKYELGRHGTFHLREDWLPRGIKVADSVNGFDSSLETADRLGLGSRMVKSLAFWMEATNLTEKRTSETGTKKQLTRLSDFGRKVRELDPYFEFPMTLWAAHLNLVRRQGTVWNWFFSEYGMRLFDRETCIEGFVRHLREKASNTPVMNTCQREVNCLLALYSKPSTGETMDPEDVTISPFRSLGLLVRNLDTGTYEKCKPIDKIPVEAFLAAVSSMHSDEKYATIKLSELVAGRNSPGRFMNLESDTVSDLAEQAADEYSDLKEGGVEISLLGADRVLRLPTLAPKFWLTLHFDKFMDVKRK